MSRFKRLGCSEAHALNKSKNTFCSLTFSKTFLVLWLKVAGRFYADPIAAKLKTDSVTCDKAGTADIGLAAIQQTRGLPTA